MLKARLLNQWLSRSSKKGEDVCVPLIDEGTRAGIFTAHLRHRPACNVNLKSAVECQELACSADCRAATAASMLTKDEARRLVAPTLFKIICSKLP